MGVSDTDSNREASLVRIAVIVNAGAMASCVAAIGDVFAIANALLARDVTMLLTVPRFKVNWLGARTGVIELSSGLSVPATTTLECDPDVLIVPALGNCGPEAVMPLIESLSREQGIVADAVARGIRTASVCTGTFLVASTGSLDGERAAVSWDVQAGVPESLSSC